MVQAQLAKAAPVKANARELSSQRKHMHTHAHTKKNSLTNGVTVKIKMYNVSFFSVLYTTSFQKGKNTFHRLSFKNLKKKGLSISTVCISGSLEEVRLLRIYMYRHGG